MEYNKYTVPAGVSMAARHQHNAHLNEQLQKREDRPSPEQKAEEVTPERLRSDPDIPCAQWQNLCSSYKNKIQANAPMAVIIKDFDRLDHYFRTTVEVLQKEIYHLDCQVFRKKLCVFCGCEYEQRYNDKALCVHHVGPAIHQGSSNCAKCLQPRKLYSCCFCCHECSRGCQLSRHASYD